METISLNADQLPIDATPEHLTWRVETSGEFIDFTLRNGKFECERFDAQFDENEPEPEAVKISLRVAVQLAQPHIRGDFYNPNTEQFVGLWVTN